MKIYFSFLFHFNIFFFLYIKMWLFWTKSYFLISIRIISQCGIMVSRFVFLDLLSSEFTPLWMSHTFGPYVTSKLRLENLHFSFMVFNIYSFCLFFYIDKNYQKVMAPLLYNLLYLIKNKIQLLYTMCISSTYLNIYERIMYIIDRIYMHFHDIIHIYVSSKSGIANYL